VRFYPTLPPVYEASVTAEARKQIDREFLSMLSSCRAGPLPGDHVESGGFLLADPKWPLETTAAIVGTRPASRPAPWTASSPWSSGSARSVRRRTGRSRAKRSATRSPRRWRPTACSSLACDPPGWHAEIEGWREQYGNVVLDFPTSERRRMAAACDRFRVAVIEGDLTHDGDPALARHVGHTIAKETPYETIIGKEHPDSPRKIDAAVASVVAFERAAWHASRWSGLPLVTFT
jgi:hypothetical protein